MGIQIWEPSFVFKDVIYLFLERGEGKERGRETFPGMCLDWELNQQPFGSQAGTQSTEPHQPGNGNHLLICM